jgi:hypothetical protein
MHAVALRPTEGCRRIGTSVTWWRLWPSPLLRKDLLLLRAHRLRSGNGAQPNRMSISEYARASKRASPLPDKICPTFRIVTDGSAHAR